jgi:Protein of unknown function (DUF2783)
MSDVKLTPNIDRPDDFYEMLVALTHGLDEADSLRAQARLILIMANQIGNVDQLAAMIHLARTPQA